MSLKAECYLFYDIVFLSLAVSGPWEIVWAPGTSHFVSLTFHLT
jgi:hypothetical protein